MKLNKIILGGAAIIATSLTAFAFKSSNRFGAGTLATFNGTSYTNVACQRTGSGGACASVTYYTRINHTNIGKTAKISVE